MVLNHVWGLFFQPKKEWKSIKEERCTVGKCFCSHVLILAAIPASPLHRHHPGRLVIWRV